QMRGILDACAELVVRRLRQLVALDIDGNAGREIVDTPKQGRIETARCKGAARSRFQYAANAVRAGRGDPAVGPEAGRSLQPRTGTDVIAVVDAVLVQIGAA